MKRGGLIDIHRHLEAAPALEDLPPLIKRYNLDLPRDIEPLRRALLFHSRPGDLVSFLEPFVNHIHKFFISYDSVKEFTFLAIQRAHQEGIDHLELRFSPYYMTGMYAGTKQLDAETIIRAVIEARDECKDTIPVSVKLILIVGRELEMSCGHRVIEYAVRYRNSVAGVDLAGDEAHFPPQLFKDVFEKAQAEGLSITIHAGEAGPAENIRYAVEHLGASRIGHGVAAVGDSYVIELLKERNIPLEMCLHSNWLTGAVKESIRLHPILTLLRAGVLVTLNTDDPMIQGTWMSDERALFESMGGTPEELSLIQSNARKCAFL